jgi:ketosteroid isomerase-like protein
MVLFPTLYRRQAALIFGLSPRSRLKRALLRRALVSGWAAWNRRDFKLMLVRYAPDVEFEFDPGQQTLGLGGTFHGREEMMDGLIKWLEVWDSWEVEPAYVVDLGDRLLALGIAHARAGGVRLKEEFAQTVTLRDGLISHDGPSGLIRWDDALRNADLDPEAITLPRHKRSSRE